MQLCATRSGNLQGNSGDLQMNNLKCNNQDVEVALESFLQPKGESKNHIVNKLL